MSSQTKQKKIIRSLLSDSNHLLSGILIGIIIGTFLAMFISRMLPISVPWVISLVTALFIFTIALVYLSFRFRDKILSFFWGKGVKYDDLLYNTQEAISSVLIKLVNKLLDQTPLSPEAQKNVRLFVPKIIGQVLWSKYRNWAFKTLISIIILLTGLLGSALLYNQNKLIDLQANLQEANRRGALIVMMSNIMDVVDKELKTNSDTSISQQTIARISALSKGLRPYKFLENGTLTTTEYSPERGQLLLALMNCGIDSLTLAQIYTKTTFHNVYLKNAVLNKFDLNNLDLEYADFRNTKLKKTNFNQTHFKHTNFNGAVADSANFSGAEIHDSNFSSTSTILNDANFLSAKMEHTNFTNAELRRVNFRSCKLYACDFINTTCFGSFFCDADLQYSSFRGSNLSNAKFSNANLSNVNFTGTTLKNADLSNADLQGVINLTYAQLEQVHSVKGCKNLDEGIRKKLEINHPDLFKNQPLKGCYSN